MQYGILGGILEKTLGKRNLNEVWNLFNIIYKHCQFTKYNKCTVLLLDVNNWENWICCLWTRVIVCSKTGCGGTLIKSNKLYIS